jgi:hypothetical protein
MAMQTTDQVKEIQQDGLELDRESLVERAKKVSREHMRIEASRLDEDLTARHAIVKSLKPEERDRFIEHMKTVPRPAAAPVLSREIKLPPTQVLEYLVLRPPFAGFWGEPRLVSSRCNNITGGPPVGVCKTSQEGRPAEGVLSIEAAIGDFFNVQCPSDERPWVIGEACTAQAVIGFGRSTGLVLTQPVLVTVEMDVILEGQASPWTYYMFPGEPETGLGLVGFLGIATMGLQASGYPTNLSTETYERFLLGSASAYFPGDIDVRTSFTLRQSLLAQPNPNNNPLWYAFYLLGDLAAFRSIPASGRGNPGYAQANLTVPGSNAALGPSTPIKVTEVRAAISIPWWL